MITPTRKDNHAKVHLLLLGSTILVSTSFTVAKIITYSLDPVVLTFVRFLLAALILLPLISLKHGLKPGISACFRYALISGCLVLFFWSMFLSLRYTTSLNVSVLFTLVPAISGMYSIVLVRERFNVNLLLALIIGLVGALWVIFQGDIDLVRTLSWNRGDLIFFGGCLAMGLYTPLIRLLYRNEPMEVMTFWILVTGCIWLLPGAVLGLLQISWVEIPTSTWLWILYLAVFSTIISFYLTQYATRFIGPTRTIAYSYLYPALVMILDLFLGKGWPDMRIIPGVILTMATMILLLVPSFAGKPSGKNHSSELRR